MATSSSQGYLPWIVLLAVFPLMLVMTLAAGSAEGIELVDFLTLKLIGRRTFKGQTSRAGQTAISSTGIRPPGDNHPAGRRVLTGISWLQPYSARSRTGSSPSASRCIIDVHRCRHIHPRAPCPCRFGVWRDYAMFRGGSWSQDQNGCIPDLACTDCKIDRRVYERHPEKTHDISCTVGLRLACNKELGRQIVQLGFEDVSP
jgi:hypothetical protein